MRIEIYLPHNRDYCGSLSAFNDDETYAYGPVAIAGRAHDRLARLHGNPDRDPLLPYGDPPTGSYRIRRMTLEPLAIALEPRDGQAAMAEANGRATIHIIASDEHSGETLAATSGSLRVSFHDLHELISALQQTSTVVTCAVLTGGDEGAPVREEVGLPSLTAETITSALVGSEDDDLARQKARRQELAATSKRVIGRVAFSSATISGGLSSFSTTYGPGPSRIVTITGQLAGENPNPYLPAGATTQCSAFVRDAATQFDASLAGTFAGQVANQVKALQGSSRFSSFTDSPNAQAAYTKAQQLAVAGQLVIVAWLNPTPTPTNTGHICIVLPDGLLQSTAFGAQVPYVAQAGKAQTGFCQTNGVNAKFSMACAFDSSMKGSLLFFATP